MNRDGKIIKTSVVGIVGNLFLVVAKAIIGIVASSVSIITDAANNLTDAMSSIVTIVGTKLSNKRPDRKHPFGHGRIEFITSALIGMIIFVAGATAIFESISSIIAKETPVYTLYSFIVIGVAVVAKIVLGIYFRMRGKKLSSDALSASGLDALMDSILSFGTLVGAIISYTAGFHLEGYIGVVIGLLIIKSAVDVFREAASKIIGERTDPELASNLTADVMKNPKVYGVYDLILNNYGEDRYIGSLHVEVDDHMIAKDIQLLEREIAYLCYEKYHAVMTVGVYARSTESEYEAGIKKCVGEIIEGYPEIIQTHGFYVDEKNRVISLDIIISFECKQPDRIYREVHDKISEKFKDFTVQLILDKDYTLT